jgi:hypothetical protein
MEVEPSAFDPARPGFVPQQVPKVNYKKGEHVEVFYKIAEDTAGFFPVAIGNLGSLTPRVGMTDGWMAAYVEDDFSHEEFVVESARKKKLKEEQDAAREAARHHRFDDNRSGPPPNPPPVRSPSPLFLLSVLSLPVPSLPSFRPVTPPLFSIFFRSSIQFTSLPFIHPSIHPSIHSPIISLGQGGGGEGCLTKFP